MVLLDFFSLDTPFFTLWGYTMSHLEWWATVLGAVAVWLSVKENSWSWIIGLGNVCLAFLMFYQIQLYPDMLLQVFFFITNIIGFWQWKFPKATEQNDHQELRISQLSTNQRVLSALGAVLGTLVMGTFAGNLHHWFPSVFSLPSAYPYIDSFTTLMSIGATFLLIRKKVEAWWVWLAVDILSTYMYYTKDVKFYALLYALFCVIAIKGAWEWTKKYQAQT